MVRCVRWAGRVWFNVNEGVAYASVEAWIREKAKE
jgi:hypothetical protein